MSTPLATKMDMLIQWQVVVTEMRSGAPWPVATIQFLEGGACRLVGSATAAYAPLLSATKKAATTLALQTMKQQLTDELYPSPAQSLETAASPEKPRRDVPLAPSNEAAASISQPLDVTLPPNL
jgi:hypothetical protein